MARSGKARPALLLLICFLAIVALGLIQGPWTGPYRILRELGKVKTLGKLQEYQVIESEHFRLLYAPEDQTIAPLVLQAAEDVYEPVVRHLGYRPSGPAPLVIHPDRDTFRRAFGWTAEESAMGAYWTGVIDLLSPHAWVRADNLAEKADIFRRLGPLAHEFAHYVLDYRTNGNYPRWFTEGVAQWVEQAVTGYLWIEPRSTLHQRLYSYTELDRQFDTLSNQALAYRQSYLMVDYLVRHWGEDGLQELIAHLAAGTPFQSALERVTGYDAVVFEQQWLVWLADNMDLIEQFGSLAEADGFQRRS